VVSAKARGIPRRVLGRWTRNVTPSEAARTQSFRNQADGIPLLAGTWQVRIGADGETAAVVPRTTTSEIHRYKANATDKRAAARLTPKGQ
jgi:hypothetical protein